MIVDLCYDMYLHGYRGERQLITEIAMSDISVFPHKKCHNRYRPSCTTYLQYHCSSEKKVIYKVEEN